MSKLIVAIPSKGRIQEESAGFFARAGLDLVKARGQRGYRGSIAGFDAVEVAYLSASEIARHLARGEAHFGVTGEDLVREEIADVEKTVEILTPLGFGAANAVVAVPQAWIDVRTMADLADVADGFRARHGRGLRVATKYVNTTRRFFAQHGIGDYRVVESAGATEGAPASGAADLIVDITETGSTLVANALKVLDDGVILRSQVGLVASLAARWSDEAREAARVILSRIAAEEEARTTREVCARLVTLDDKVMRKAAAKFGATTREAHEDGAVVFACPAKQVAALADWLISEGARTVSSARLDYVFHAENELWSRLSAKIRA